MRKMFVFCLLILVSAPAYADCAIDWRTQWQRMPGPVRMDFALLTGISASIAYTAGLREGGDQREAKRVAGVVDDYDTLHKLKAAAKALAEKMSDVYDSNNHDCVHPSTIGSVLVLKRLGMPGTDAVLRRIRKNR